MALNREKKLRYILGLILAALLLCYAAAPSMSGIYVWPIKQFYQESDSDEKLQEEVYEQNYKYPWELCQPMSYFSGNESRPVTALASFPGSGNTWVRYLLQQSTGIFTGHEGRFMKNDTFLQLHGFPGEGVSDSRVIVVKTHSTVSSARLKYDRAVLLIRDPGAAILANFNRLKSKRNHTGNASRLSFSLLWKKFFYQTLPRWRNTNLDWLQNFKGSLHVLIYEDLVNNLEVTLRALITFLNPPVDEEALQCTLQRPEGAFHRKQQSYDFELFDSEMLDKIKTDKDVVYQEIKRRRN